MLSFNLPDSFVDKYRDLPEPFGFGALGAVTFYRTYARKLDNNVLERWAETCHRVINGMYSIQKDYCLSHGKPWSDQKAETSAMEAYDRLFNLKWSPPGRGIAHMGAPSVHERGMIEALQNCGYISTESIVEHRGMLFYWVMEMLMLGIGVGFDVKGAGKLKISKPQEMYRIYQIPDTREGWCEATRLSIDSFISGAGQWVFDYSKIRPKGEEIKGFGGISSGPEPLIDMHNQVRSMLNKLHGQPFSATVITDIMNMIGTVVVAGNVRRSSEIALGYPDDEEFVNLKNYELHPERAAWGWASNNSIYAYPGMDYSPFLDRVLKNGEPGFVWMDNVNSYARMNGVTDYSDDATGFNPCGEQPLVGWSNAGLGGELCTLVELYPDRHTDIYDFLRSIKFAYLYGKTVTLLSEKIRHPGTRDIMMRNRRIGLSMTGIAQFVTSRGVGELSKWARTGYEYVRHYDKRYSIWFGVPESVRVTTVKPSGTISLVAGATPGVHYPHFEYYVRRMRMSSGSPLVQMLVDAGVHVEDDVASRDTSVASFPIHAGSNIRSSKDVSIWEQLQLAAIMQRDWSDNSVSVTVTVDPKVVSAKELNTAISMYDSSLKSVSFLPTIEGGAYAQMVYEEISEAVFNEMNSKIDYAKLNNLHLINMTSTAMRDMYCDGVACEIPQTSNINAR